MRADHDALTGAGDDDWHNRAALGGLRSAAWGQRWRANRYQKRRLISE
jgi:hypothetical protein